MATPPLGYVSIECDDPPSSVVCRLGEERPEVTDGYGGWNEVARPRRTTVTTWAGVPARRMSLSILMDNWAAGIGIEYLIRRLERMALPRSGGQPPTVKVDAAGGHLPYQGKTWVIDAIAWGDALMNSLGNRTRQAATLTLLEYVSDDLIEAKKRSAAQRRRAKQQAAKNSKGKNAKAKRKATAKKRGSNRKKKSGRLATVTDSSFQGEDLMAIAARELGDVTRWREIAELNDIRDPRAVRVGQVLRLP
jgi:hypothetical protein